MARLAKASEPRRIGQRPLKPFILVRIQAPQQANERMFLKNYFKYLKDNPNHLWFKRKLYGWGWVPVRWQGWAVVLAFIVFSILNGIYLEQFSEPSNSDIAWFSVRIAIAVVVLIYICYKTGEKPRWQWGVQKN